ncbi:MAG: TerC family protein [Devosia sp.]|nr:TerC family protein [Devosia sp.]
MLALLTDPSTWIAFGTLTAMEVVLGIDNIVFISVLVSRLPKASADTARSIGLLLALGFRIALLLILTWMIGLTAPVISAYGIDLSWKDLILIAGGGFLIYKATHEMHMAVEEPGEGEAKAAPPKGSLLMIIAQIILIDLVFSIDSIVTAIGMAQRIEVMIAAVVVAVGIMYAASGPVAGFITRHPTTKMLALAFLLLIGVTLAADGLGFHIDKGYIYAAMAFSTAVEAINILTRQRRLAAEAAPAVVASAPAAAADAPRAKSKSTPQARAQARPKSAPRKGK